MTLFYTHYMTQGISASNNTVYYNGALKVFFKWTEPF